MCRECDVIGRLNTRIALIGRGSGEDALGQPVETWIEFGKAWADVRFVSGIETIKAGRETSTSKCSAKMRMNKLITRDMRIGIGEVTYKIVDIIPDMKTRAYMTLICEVAL